LYNIACLEIVCNHFIQKILKKVAYLEISVDFSTYLT